MIKLGGRMIFSARFSKVACGIGPCHHSHIFEYYNFNGWLTFAELVEELMRLDAGVITKEFGG